MDSAKIPTSMDFFSSMEGLVRPSSAGKPSLRTGSWLDIGY